METETKKIFPMSQILAPMQQRHCIVAFVFFFSSILKAVPICFWLTLRSIKKGTQLQNTSLQVDHSEAPGESEHLIRTPPSIFRKTAWVCIYIYKNLNYRIYAYDMRLYHTSVSRSEFLSWLSFIFS